MTELGDARLAKVVGKTEVPGVLRTWPSCVAMMPPWRPAIFPSGRTRTAQAGPGDVGWAGSPPSEHGSRICQTYERKDAALLAIQVQDEWTVTAVRGDHVFIIVRTKPGSDAESPPISIA